MLKDSEHTFIYFLSLLILIRATGGWSLSYLTLGERQGTPINLLSACLWSVGGGRRTRADTRRTSRAESTINIIPAYNQHVNV